MPPLRYTGRKSRLDGVGERFVVIASSRLLASAIVEVIKRRGPPSSIEVFDRAAEGLAAMRRARANFAIVQSETEDIDGLDFIPEIIAGNLAGRTVIITSDLRRRKIFGLARLNFSGWLDGNASDVADLGRAISEARSGRRYISRTLKKLCLEGRRDPVALMLTPKEEFIFSLLGAGLDDKRAADKVGISPATIATHRARIMRKLDIHHRGELIFNAIGLGYTRPSSSGFLHPGFHFQMARLGGGGEVPPIRP